MHERINQALREALRLLERPMPPDPEPEADSAKPQPPDTERT